MPPKTRNRRKVNGVISRDRMYSTAALEEAGIGKLTQMDMRADGVAPHVVGVNHWYDGSEVADWIASQRKVKSRAKKQTSEV